MSIVLAVFTDGRDDLLAQTLASADEKLRGPITSRIIFDDTGDIDHGEHLSHLYPRFCIVHHTHRLGFGGSIGDAWRYLAHRDEEFILHLEDDQTFNRPVDLTEMARVLDEQPHLAQMALRRQPWNEDEKAAGGIVEQHPDDYTEVTDGTATWLQHRLFFTTNVSLYRRSLMDRGWPDVEQSEGMFSLDLFKAPEVRSGYWGTRNDGPWIEHIGYVRVGHGY